MEPTIEKMTKDKEMSKLISLRQDVLQKKIDVIESVVLRSDSKSTAFEEVYLTISENEKSRKMTQELISHQMQNVITEN